MWGGQRSLALGGVPGGAVPTAPLGTQQQDRLPSELPGSPGLRSTREMTQTFGNVVPAPPARAQGLCHAV